MYSTKILIKTIVFILLLFIFGCGNKESIKDDAVSIDNPIHVKYEMSFKGKTIKNISISVQKKKYVYFEADYNNAGIQSNTLTVYNDGNDNIFVISYKEGNKTGTKFRLVDLISILKDSIVFVFERLYNKNTLDKMTEEGGTEQYVNRVCDVYNFQNHGVIGKFFIYKNFVMLGADFVDGRLTMKATSFEPNSSISESTFIPTSATEFKDGTELINNYKQKQTKGVKKDDSWIVNDMIYLPGLDGVKLLFTE